MQRISKQALFAFFISLALALAFIVYAVTNRSNLERLQMEQIVSEKVQRVDTVLTQLFYRTEILAALVRQGEGTIDNFDRVAPSIVNDPAILNILIAPNGVVSHAFSLADDVTPLLGHDFFADLAGNMEAMDAINRGELLMAGPFIGRQDRMIIAGRLPVFLDAEENDFWGLVSVTLKWPEALDNAELEFLRIQGFEYEMWRIDPDTGERQILNTNLEAARSGARFEERSMLIQNAEWHLMLLSTWRWYRSPEILALMAAGLIISLLAAYIAQYNARLNKMTLELKAAHREVMESIIYAGKIQGNLLPNEQVFNEAFADYSVLWNPRDIVGGDIYWAKNFHDGTVLCVCDCTGHGTPGALLTMLVVSTFEAYINEENYSDTAQIVYLLDKRLASVLHVDDTEKKNRKATAIDDGCDLAVLFIAKNGDVTLSAGNIHVFVCDGKEVKQVKGQKLFVGEGQIKSKDDVAVNRIGAHSGDKFYIASDGLFDQIGGENKKSFGYKRFKELILENHHEKQTTVSAKVWDAFEKYRGDQSQRDDVEMVTFKK
ncbi:MAG: SpoIIE family protein phosphatase [Defluviitaleaceae bacterium]|nr:SpoIIE family protein phosphatase [Defluviitaleaceae bacterium]